MESWSTKLSIILSMSNKYSTFIFKFTNTQKTFVIKPFKPPWSPFEDVTLLFDVSNLWPLVFKKSTLSGNQKIIHFMKNILFSFTFIKYIDLINKTENLFFIVGNPFSNEKSLSKNWGKPT